MKNTFGKRLQTMLHVDFRRMFTTPLLYILLAACFLMPVLILVMTTMMDGSISVNPKTGVETVIEGFDNVWQIIGSVSNAAPAGEMSMMSMCNINMLYFILCVPVCLFVSQDFRSGYAKNLFAVRAKKTDYVISKTLVCYLSSALMLLAFFLGALVGGKIAGLPFGMEGFDTGNLVLCVLSKMALCGVFAAIYLCMAVIARQRAWMSILLSLMVGMFLFMMIPMLTPLDASAVHVLGCAAGSVLFAAIFGAVSNKILKTSSLV